MWQAPDFVDTCQFHKVLPFELRRLSIDLPKGGCPGGGSAGYVFQERALPSPTVTNGTPSTRLNDHIHCAVVQRYRVSRIAGAKSEKETAALLAHVARR